MADDAFTGGSAYAKPTADKQRTEDGGQTPDSELLRRYATERSEAAFAELVRRYLDLVYSAALRQVGGDAHRAHDVAQVVFTILARKAEALTRHPALVGWLYTTTSLAAGKVRRTEARRHARELEAHAMNEPAAASAPEIDWDRMRPVLDDAMRRLDDRDRTAVLLRYFAHRPFAEIGATLNLSEDGARMRVDRAVDKLRGLLARRGVTSTAAALALVLTHQAVAAAPAGLAAQVTGGALASGAAATGNLFYFMSTTKITVAIAAAAMILTLGGAGYEARIAAAAQSALELARQEDAALRNRMQALEAKVRAGDQELAQLQTSLDEARAAAKSAPPAGAARPPAAVGGGVPAAMIEAGNAYLVANPDVKQALVDRSRARVASRYYPLYAKLKLTPEQIERFETLLIEYEGITNNGPAGAMMLRPGTGMARDQVEQSVRDLLGPDNFKEYQMATRLAGAQQFTTALASALYFTDTPLTAAQAEQLGKIVIDSPRRPDRPGTTSDWDQLIQRARGYLSEPQIAVITRIRAQEEFGFTMKSLTLPTGGK